MQTKKQQKEVADGRLVKVGFLLIQLSLFGLFCYLSFLPTVRMDFFSWGDRRADGLYLVIVPIVILPMVTFLSIVKYLFQWRANISIFKHSALAGWVSVFLCTFIIIVSDAGKTAIVSVVLSVLTCIFLVYESIVAGSRFFKKRKLP